MYRNLIWDLDGTLFDTYPAIVASYLATLQELGCEADRDWVMRLAIKSQSHCTATLAEVFRLDGAILERIFITRYNCVTPEHQPPLPGVIELCRYIYNLGGKNVIVTHRGRASSLELLSAHRMTGYFAGCITSDDGYPRKPDPTSINIALSLFELERSETLAI
ncbi:MAG: HAD hydrolase-like protein, partial [Anaerolineae bacterium]